MGPHEDIDVEITGRATILSGLALAGQPDPIAVVDTGRHLDRQRAGLAYPASTATVAAGIVDDLAGTATRRTGLLHREKALLHTHLPRSAASRTRRRRAAFLRARPITGFAARERRHGYLHLVAEHGLLEIERQLVAQISATINVRAATPAAATEYVAEDIAKEVRECVGPLESAAHAGC